MNDKEYLRYGSLQVITPVEGEEKLDSWNENKLTNSEIIGSIGGHEIYHALNDMSNGRKLTDEEHENAKEVENIIIKEFGKK